MDDRCLLEEELDGDSDSATALIVLIAPVFVFVSGCTSLVSLLL